jgi:hypothetical protein
VVSSKSFPDALRAKLANHIELLLTTSGVLISIALTFAQLDQSTRSMAFVFLVWLQGFLIWAVRRHSRLGRERLIRKLRVMLQDRVNNQLTVLIGMAELRGGPEPPVGVDDIQTAVTAARAVAQELEGLSLESLRLWELRYARFLPLQLR